MNSKGKHEIVTFKVDESLMSALKAIPNRSEFIRNALLSALDSACPLCRGTGILTAEQRRHWQSFTTTHSVKECSHCHAVHLVCEQVESSVH